MTRSRILTIAALALTPVIVTGCAPQITMEELMQKPTPGDRLAVLDQLLGQWNDTANIVSPTPQEMQKTMPEGEEMPTSSEGTYSAKWELDNMFLVIKGQYTWDDKAVEWIECWTWDAKAKKYRTHYFNNWGEFGQGTYTYCPDTRTFKGKGTGTSTHGFTSGYDGCMKFVDDNTIEWKWTERGPMGKFVVEGKSTRK